MTTGTSMMLTREVQEAVSLLSDALAQDRAGLEREEHP